jgi:hypothetical protein
MLQDFLETFVHESGINLLEDDINNLEGYKYF